MDFLAKSISEKYSDPMEFLNQLRMTTEPIGGSTKYDNNGELVKYEVTVEAVNKTIDKACNIIKQKLEGCIIREFLTGNSHKIETLIEDFREEMKEE